MNDDYVILLAGCVQVLCLYVIADIKSSIRDLWSEFRDHEKEKEAHK
jgi:hypothetical protein